MSTQQKTLFSSLVVILNSAGGTLLWKLLDPEFQTYAHTTLGVITLLYATIGWMILLLIVSYLLIVPLSQELVTLEQSSPNPVSKRTAHRAGINRVVEVLRPGLVKKFIFFSLWSPFVMTPIVGLENTFSGGPSIITVWMGVFFNVLLALAIWSHRADWEEQQRVSNT